MKLPTQTQKTSAGTAVIDANVLVSICSNEPSHQTARDALADYTAKGWVLYAPGAILTEVLFILCKKLQAGSLIEVEHQKAVQVSTA